MPTDVSKADLATLVKMFDDKNKAITLLEEDRVKRIAAIDADIKTAQDDLKPIQRRLAELLGVSGGTASHTRATTASSSGRTRTSPEELARIERELLNLMQPGESYKMADLTERIPVQVPTMRNVVAKLIDAGTLAKEGEKRSTVYMRV